jgi:hypothetical protein
VIHCCYDRIRGSHALAAQTLAGALVGSLAPLIVFRRMQLVVSDDDPYSDPVRGRPHRAKRACRMSTTTAQSVIGLIRLATEICLSQQNQRRYKRGADIVTVEGSVVEGMAAPSRMVLVLKRCHANCGHLCSGQSVIDVSGQRGVASADWVGRAMIGLCGHSQRINRLPRCRRHIALRRQVPLSAYLSRELG